MQNCAQWLSAEMQPPDATSRGISTCYTGMDDKVETGWKRRHREMSY
jgi:hypothetical protein